MTRYWRPASFCCFLAIWAALIWSAYATPLPAATPPTATVPGPTQTPRLVVVTRVVVVTPRPTALPTVSAWMLTATAEAQPRVDYTPPPPTAGTSCFYARVEFCNWTTPYPAPTSQPLEGMTP